MSTRQIIGMMLLATALSACVSSTPTDKIPYWQEQADVTLDKGLLAYEQYQFPEAIDRFTEALLYYQQLDDARGRAQTRINLARSYLGLGQWSDVEVQLGWAEKLIRQNTLTDLQDHVDALRTRVWLARGKPELAGAILSKLTPPKDRKLSAVELALWLNRAQWLLDTDQPLEPALAVIKPYADKPDVAARLAWFRARQAADANDFDGAEKAYARALLLYRQQANPYGIYTLLQDWNRRMMQGKQWQRSLKLLEKLTLMSLGRGDEAASRANLQLCRQVLEAMDDPRARKIPVLLDELHSRHTLSSASLLLLFPGATQ